MRTEISDARSEIGIARRGTLGELDRKLCERHGGDDASLLRHNNDLISYSGGTQLSSNVFHFRLEEE